jgi:transposase-like protein
MTEYYKYKSDKFLMSYGQGNCPICGGRLAFKCDDPLKAVKHFECKKCGRWFTKTHIEEEERFVPEVVVFS